MDVTLWGKSKTCIFNFEEQRIKPILSQPISKQKKKPVDTRKEKNLNLINPKEIEKEVIRRAQVIVLVAREVAKESHETILPKVAPIITKFADVFPNDLSSIAVDAERSTCNWSSSESHSTQLAVLSYEPDETCRITKVSWRVIEQRVHTREFEPLRGPRTVNAEERWNMAYMCG